MFPSFPACVQGRAQVNGDDVGNDLLDVVENHEERRQRPDQPGQNGRWQFIAGQWMKGGAVRLQAQPDAGQVVDRRLEVPHQKAGQVAAEARAHDDPLDDEASWFAGME